MSNPMNIPMTTNMSMSMSMTTITSILMKNILTIIIMITRANTIITPT